MRAAPALALLLVLAGGLAGCADDGPRVARVGVDTYYVSTDSDLRNDWSDGSSQVVTCAGGKHVHLLYVRGGAEGWTNTNGWTVHSRKSDALTMKIDEWPDRLGIYACLPDGEVATSVSYARGGQVLGVGVVNLPPLHV